LTAYVAASDFVEYVNGDSDVAADPLVANLIARGQGFIESYTGRVFSADSTDTDIGAATSSDTWVARLFDAEADIDGATLFLDRDLCTLGDVLNGDSDAPAIVSSNIITEPRNNPPYYALKIRPSSGLAWQFDDDNENAISVSGVWAFSLTPPLEIQHALLRLSKYWYQQRNYDNDADRPVRTAEGVVIEPSRIPADITAILDKYRRIRVGGV